MADYAGAVAAIKARFVEQWIVGDQPRTPISFQNETPPRPWPPTDATGALIPWVYFEVIGTMSDIVGAGKPGSQTWLYNGRIYAHVFVPENSGIEIVHQLAVAAGEIFRAQGFYNDGAGSIVRTWAPQTDGGASDADNGNWFRVTCSIKFEFYYRG